MIPRVNERGETSMELTDEQLKAIRSFQLLTQKQCLAIVNGNFTTINTDDTLSP